MLHSAKDALQIIIQTGNSNGKQVFEWKDIKNPVRPM